MTKKRFIRISVCGDWGVKDTEKDKVLFFGTTDEVIDTVDLLNDLNDENEQLRKDLKIIEEHRKQETEYTARLEKENENIKETIKSAINTERTALGKSVLKQLWDAIQ